MAKKKGSMRPEGAVIDGAFEARKAKEPRFSWRKAADEARLSEGRLRQIRDGWQSAGGEWFEVVAPDDTLARIGRALGVTPEQFIQAGRPDAAEAMRTRDFRAGVDDFMALQQSIQDWAEDPLSLLPPDGILALFDQSALLGELQRRAREGDPTLGQPFTYAEDIAGDLPGSP